ncbi:GCN5-related N-acetyltransferase OS=Tsukamurella paurometabola (strain ATCC 8368 / DSM / CCUG 35730 / CIP 100753 / JCM 10117 / KCTC 9821 / NBRC 16120 /NCIMB 702349 / NCTC 13040) OX=521096 GN=Tpau_2925 PE=4 SV=1 [Tsukamurella paurometabola]|uniref:GCN5-related N-acetyltransferase n=1 Tax=Tsukamurella paurometabola (strain ATCC 8368 / DSM 20162 / CCUG 35730 / CIP 100753 / JCM 10117 / KCTC 9821 / NBRC 16120 / NCIMB 702349 / NCTC 13040) TaxID=521096 RepID=D5UU20_TSUPD|nr:N-acetyltransferase [Tsukamurella paurometabola]ADG79523.1 GCN5-related N-acetyltransferase [Tsukamurella paurometabola DSM 20162]SUP36083.1 Predicted acetyltransferase [Tsukamurella paurometabola]
MLIRRELPGDIAAIAAVHRSAFAALAPPDHETPVEVGLVAALRDSSAWIPELSLVAEAAGTVVGHVCLTRGTVDDRPVLALGPLGVRTDAQSGGTGSALMHAPLSAADALGEPLVVLLGHAGYYPRFGFVAAADLGIRPDVADWAGDSFLARPLTSYTADLTGEFRYPRPFYEL